MTVKTKSCRRSGLVLAVQLLFVTGIGMGVAIGLVQATRGQTNTSQLPSELGGLRLLQVMAGPDALAEIYRLHQKDLGLVDGWVGHYEEGATVWVSQATDEAQAAALLAAMTRDIQAGEGGFQHEGEEQIQGVAVHRVRGQGGAHFYYQKGDRAVWVTAPPTVARAFLAQAVEGIP